MCYVYLYFDELCCLLGIFSELYLEVSVFIKDDDS